MGNAKAGGAVVRIKEPVQKRSKETRARIIEAAGLVFAEHGFEAATTTMIAREAGLSIGSIYAHFVDKIDIFVEILAAHSESVYRYVEEGIDRIIREQDPSEQAIERLVMGTYRAHKRAGKLNYEMKRFVMMNERAEKIYWDWESREDELILRFLEHFRDRITIEDLESAAVVMHRSFHEVFIHLFRNRGRVDEQRILSEFIRMLKGYLME
jgi:AcrR family transcriptional regulator